VAHVLGLSLAEPDPSASVSQLELVFREWSNRRSGAGERSSSVTACS